MVERVWTMTIIPKRRQIVEESMKVMTRDNSGAEVVYKHNNSRGSHTIANSNKVRKAPMKAQTVL